MRIYYKNPTEDDLKKFGLVVSDRIKIIAENEYGHRAFVFMEPERFERLGKEYIESHVKFYYSKTFEDWFLNISENDYYNDLQRNPEKIISLRFEGKENGTGREIYRSIETDRFYLRENHFPREHFARWLICGKRRRIDDGDEPRSNIIFECDGQYEKVTYDDWNGVAAYSDTFNVRFGKQFN